MGWQVWDYRGHPLLWHSGSGDGQLAFMALYPEDSLGVVVLLNSWVLASTPPVHGAIAGCIADALLALAPPNCAGDAAALRARDVARWDSVQRVFQSSRIAGTAPSRPLAAYAGTFADSLYGPFYVRAERAGLTLQVGDAGEVAELTHWHLDTFIARWRRPFQRMYFSTLVTFGVDADGTVGGVQLRLRNAQASATRVAATAR